MNASLKRRLAEFDRAMNHGHAACGNHTLKVEESVIQQAWYCSTCPMSASCYFGGQIVDFSTASKAGYPCVQNKNVAFMYHGATVLVFDFHKRTLNDNGYYGYSVSTSRALSWYIAVLVERDFIAPSKAHAAIAFFRGRKDNVRSNDKTLPPFQC